MKYLGIILSLFIMSPTISWTQENSEERLSAVIELQGLAKELEILKQAWHSYKLEDYENALALWMPLAEGGNSSAQGLMYNKGHAVGQDNKSAARWYTMASEQGHTPAKWRLAILYYHGAGLAQDYQKAANLYHSAAKQGDVYSQKTLGVIYSKGLGVPQDYVLAYSWFHIAGTNGFNFSKRHQNEIANNMTPEEIAIAQAMAIECLHSGYTNCGWVLNLADGAIKDDT